VCLIFFFFFFVFFYFFILLYLKIHCTKPLTPAHCRVLRGSSQALTPSTLRLHGSVGNPSGNDNTSGNDTSDGTSRKTTLLLLSSGRIVTTLFFTRSLDTSSRVLDLRRGREDEDGTLGFVVTGAKDVSGAKQTAGSRDLLLPVHCKDVRVEGVIMVQLEFFI
jgi:hypothetical protein